MPVEENTTLLYAFFSRQTPRGIGGWLLFFCLINVIARPIAFIRMFLTLHTYTYMALYVAFIAASLLVGLLVWFKSLLAFNAIWLFLVFSLIQACTLFRAALFFHLSENARIYDFTGGVTTIGATFLWFLYFRRSKRVANTFGRNL